MNQATIDALRAIFEADATAKTYFVVTPEGKHRLSPVTIGNIDAQLNCAIQPVDAGSKISFAMHIAEIYETPTLALAAFKNSQATELGKAEQDETNWGK
jgi:hypothetical protein